MALMSFGGRTAGIAAAVTLAAGCLLAGAGAAVAQPTVVYAAATAVGAGSCADPADACSLSTALGQVTAGEAVQLVTPGDTARYVGNWTVTTAGTSASQPVSIEPLPGLSSEPIIDGDSYLAPGGETCSTPSCDGPELTVPTGAYVDLTGITFTDADDNTTGLGGGMYVAGTAVVASCTFYRNYSTGGLFGAGAAIDTGDGYGTGTGSLTVTGSTFNDNVSNFGGAIASGLGATGFGYKPGGGSVSITGSTFYNNNGGDGGAIDSGDYEGGSGSVTVADSTFYDNNAGAIGGAINSGGLSGGGSVTVTGSTFADNRADTEDGGAIDSGDYQGGGSVTVTGSTFTGDSAAVNGQEIAIGDNGGAGTVSVAADVFTGSCTQTAGTWNDGGYNAGADSSCFAATPATGDDDAGSAAALQLGQLQGNGGPTQTIMPLPTSPVVGLIPNPTTVTLDGAPVALCPATDQRGYASAPGSSCDAGAVQTSGSASLSLTDSSPTQGYRQAGDVITYDYGVTNTGTTPLPVTIADPAVPDVSCPDSTLAAGAVETCTGSYTVTSADVTAGLVTDTATATGTTDAGGTITSNASTVVERVAWPLSATGIYRPAAGAAEGFYLGAAGPRWSLLVTHPGHTSVPFTGTITINAGVFDNLTSAGLGTGGTASFSHKTLSFTINNTGRVSAIRFATTAPATTITFTLDIAGQPATATQLYLGSTPTPSTTPSPLTFTR